MSFEFDLLPGALKTDLRPTHLRVKYQRGLHDIRHVLLVYERLGLK